MSYTLRGRIESRLAAFLPVLVVACVLAVALPSWWPLELAALMIGVGVLLDALIYDRVLDYQPGWLALPLGGFELALLMVLASELDLGAPRRPAVALFVAGWIAAQVLGHAVFPLARVGYAEEGGELGAVGRLAAVSVVALFVVAAGTAWSLRPPTVRLAAGVVQGPLELTHSQVLEGREGTVVKGGIIVRADDVTIRNLSVVGGENGIDVDDADDVTLENVSVSGASLDGIHVRRSSVVIRDCAVDSTASLFGQGIDVSFSAHKRHATITGCTVVGGQEGIFVDSAMAVVTRNHVSRTTLRGISMTEMSMGMIAHNEVHDARGVGILCYDHSMCEIEQNLVTNTAADEDSSDRTRRGVGVLVAYNSEAHIRGNDLEANPLPLHAALGGQVNVGEVGE